MRKVISEHRTQERAIRTRKDLMAAARRVFARDGFEVARLQDIAQEAGKTRGALYDHFADKEDLFFALIEENIEADGEFYRTRLTPESSREERVAALVDHMEAMLCDRKRVMLYLEFKMYAIRHPQKQQRLAELHEALCVKGMDSKLHLMPELFEPNSEKRRAVIAAFGAVLDGLALNLYFDPGALSPEEVRRRIEQMVRERLA